VDDILEFNYRSFTNLECALAVVAPEACLVVDVVVGGVLVDEVHRLVAGRALGGCPLEGGRHCLLPFSLSQQSQSSCYRNMASQAALELLVD
jgi:hypothetical protein